MAKKYQLTQLGVEVQALLDKMETLQANQTPTQGQETAPLESLSLNGTVYTIDMQAAEPESYQNLAVLRRTGKLVPGKSYRITDYVATTVQEDTRSANHPFDIVVMANSETNLSEDAKAVLHEGDTYFSQAGAKLDAWVIKYCFDNDATRFTWADSANGKGVVYRMVDEWGNDLPYDFKGVQFKRYNVASVEAKYQDALSPLIGLPIAHKWSKGLVRDNANFKWYYTFSMLGQTWDDEVTDGSLNGESTNGNVIKASLFYHPILCDLVCANGPVLHNFLLSLLPSGASSTNDPRYISANNEYDGESMIHNSFFGTNANVFTASQFRRNTVVGCHRHTSYETDCQDNTIFCTDDYSMNQTGHFFAGNVIVSPIFSGLNAEDDFMRNFFHLTTQGVYGHFGNNFQDNTIIGEVVNTCSIGTYFFNNTLTNISLSSTQINGQVSECVFTGRVAACSIKGIIQHIILPGGDSSNRFYGVDIVGNIRGTAEAKISLNHPAFFLPTVSGVRRRVKIEGDTDGNIVATWKDGGQTVGVMKAPGSNEWTEIPAIEMESMTANEVTAAVNTAWDNVMNA